MTTTDLIPFLKGYLEGKETLDKYQVEFLKKTLKEIVSPVIPYTGIRQPGLAGQPLQQQLNPLCGMYHVDGPGPTTVIAR